MTSRTSILTITAPQVTLGDLAWILEQATGLPPTTVVTIDKYNGDQRDPGYVTLTIRRPL